LPPEATRSAGIGTVATVVRVTGSMTLAVLSMSLLTQSCVPVPLTHMWNTPCPAEAVPRTE
jgi:hypothetical protein